MCEMACQNIQKKQEETRIEENKRLMLDIGRFSLAVMMTTIIILQSHQMNPLTLPVWGMSILTLFRAWRETLILGEFPSIHTLLSLFNSQKKMDHQYPTIAKIPVLDTEKFEQYSLYYKRYLQHEHYALWEVIEFGDSYKVPTNTDPDNTTTRKDDEQSGRTVTITTEDMQRKKNDVKARTTLLLSLPDEHQLRFNKYKTAKELWAVILKTFGGNEATKKRKKNLL
nr:hypothetical protein [Tanacetum cinerariifolium]